MLFRSFLEIWDWLFSQRVIFFQSTQGRIFLWQSKPQTQNSYETNTMVLTLVLIGLGALVVLVPIVVQVLACLQRRKVKQQVQEFQVGKDSVVRDKKLLVLVNPHGGDGLAERHCNNIVVPMLEKAGAIVTVTRTKTATHAFEIGADLARALLNNKADPDNSASSGTNTLLPYDAVLVLSGDGMFCETVSGFAGTLFEACGADVERAKQLVRLLPLAPIPCGSSNGLATSGKCLVVLLSPFLF